MHSEPHRCHAWAQISTKGLWADVGVLLAGLGCFMGLVAAARLRFSRPVGWLLLALYAVYITYEVLTVWVFDVFATRRA